MGLHPTDRQLGEIFKEVKNLGDTGKTVTDADLQTIAENALEIPRNRPIHLNELTTIQGNRITSTASVNLTLNDKTIREAATGVGPVDAAMKAVRKAISLVESIQLEQYHVEAITGGTNANVKVIVRLRKGSRTATAKRIHEDIVMASVEAMLNGMNVLLANYEKNDEIIH
jgi:D-citramalate synthase